MSSGSSEPSDSDPLVQTSNEALLHWFAKQLSLLTDPDNNSYKTRTWLGRIPGMFRKHLRGDTTSGLDERQSREFTTQLAGIILFQSSLTNLVRPDQINPDTKERWMFTQSQIWKTNIFATAYLIWLIQYVELQRAASMVGERTGDIVLRVDCLGHSGRVLYIIIDSVNPDYVRLFSRDSHDFTAGQWEDLINKEYLHPVEDKDKIWDMVLWAAYDAIESGRLRTPPDGPPNMQNYKLGFEF